MLGLLGTLSNYVLNLLYSLPGNLDTLCVSITHCLLAAFDTVCCHLLELCLAGEFLHGFEYAVVQADDGGVDALLH